jgi:hypothetical protein
VSFCLRCPLDLYVDCYFYLAEHYVDASFTFSPISNFFVSAVC